MSQWRTSSRVLVLWILLGLLGVIGFAAASMGATRPYEVEGLAFASFYLGVMWFIGLVVIGLVWLLKPPTPRGRPPEPVSFSLPPDEDS